MEKYASNLIKESRPPYWRTVKFTSTLIQVHVAQLIGSRDILSQIGYTQDIADGVAFPASVTEPDVNRLKNLAPDLFFARYEIDALIGDAHPFYELKPKIPQGEIQSPALMRRDVPPSRPQRFPPSQQSALPQAAVVTFPRVPAMLTSTFPTARRSQSPIPAVRRNRGTDPLSSSAEKVSRYTVTVHKFKALFHCGNTYSSINLRSFLEWLTNPFPRHILLSFNCRMQNQLLLGSL